MGDIVEGRYRIIRLISEGGMSSVYLAEHVLIKRRVAVKLLREDLVDDSESVERFMNEASAAGTMGHPNIVESTDMGLTRDGIPFIVFEYLEGATLTEEVYRVGGMGVHRMCRIGVQITSALQAAHDAGIVHGDLKCDNIFLCTREYPDHVKVLDFGASRFQNVEQRQRKIIGTPEFLAPEQILHPESVDRRVDIYALGLVFYEMLMAKRVFTNTTDNVDDLLRRIVRETPPPLPRSYAPPELQELLVRMLSKTPDERPSTMQEVEKALTSLAGNTRPSGNIPRLVRTAEIQPPPLSRTPVPTTSKTITNLAPPPASTLDNIPAGMRPKSPSSSNPGIAPPPTSSKPDIAAPAASNAETPVAPIVPESPSAAASQPLQITFETPASVITLPAPVAAPSKTWLVMIVLSVLALAAGVATFFVGKTTTTSGSAQGLQLHADKLASTIEQAVSALRLRAESIASSPMLRAAVETDAATLRDMMRDRDFVFAAREGETLELFSGTASWVRIPEKAAPLAVIDHPKLEIADGKIVATTGVKIGAKAVLVLAAPVNLAAVRSGIAPTHSATLLGLAEPYPIANGAAPGATEEQRLPVNVKGDAKMTGTLVMTVPAACSK